MFKNGLRIVWAFVRALVALPLLPLALGLKWLSRGAIHVRPDEILTHAEMRALQPLMAQNNRAAIVLWWRSHIYYWLVTQHGIEPTRAAQCASEMADDIEDPDGDFTVNVVVS